MVDESIGCIATFQKWFIFGVNLILFIFGLVQVGYAGYILGGAGDLGFAKDVMGGGNESVMLMLIFGIAVVIISFLGCCGAKRESKCMLWIYAVILFFMMMGQSSSVALIGVSVTFGDAIFESLWKDLDAADIDNIEQTYKCCSFNGEVADDTWPQDATDWTECSAANDWDPTETCWGKFKSSIDGNYDAIQMVAGIFLGIQVLIYFCTHYLIKSIANAEGIEKVKDDHHGSAI